MEQVQINMLGSIKIRFILLRQWKALFYICLLQIITVGLIEKLEL